MYFTIKALALCIHVLNECGNPLKLLFRFFQFCLLPCFLCFQMKLSLTDSCFTDVDLLHHGIKTLGFSLGGSAGVEKFNDLILAILYCLSTFLNLGLNVGKAILLTILTLLRLQKCCLKLGFLLLLALQRILTLLQLCFNGLQAVLIMLLILHTCRNLFLKNLDLTVKLLPADSLVLCLLTKLIHLGIQLLQFLFQTVIFHLRLLISLLILFQFLCSLFVLNIQFFQFPPGFLIFQKKTVHIQFTQSISSCKINSGCLRLTLQRSQLSGKLT